ncbi:hypothetical protein BH09VER1_BH09VER1_15790 [soil metagenome]
MKSFRILFAAFLALGVTTFSASAKEKWETKYDAAVAQAAKNNKMVLIDFTGSDWCTWCIKLDKDTFSKPAFQTYAAQNLVLLELDFPQGKPQPDAIKKQNAELAKKYGVEGYPTLVLLDAKGKEIARHEGYLEGGPDAFIKWVAAAKH